jgi:ribosomal-protein-alanine N-acetyltransferase
VNLQIRPATAVDVSSLMAIESHATTAAHWTSEQYEAAFSGAGPERIVLVAEEDIEVQGFIVGRAIEKEWEIENVVVTGAARRRGLGGRLVGRFLDLARERRASAIFLEVRESNVAARRLYEKCGFGQSGRRKSYYRQPDEDAVTYRLDLP